MLDIFKLFIEKHHLFQPTDGGIWAISGGIDSMTMLHLLARAGYRGVVAHCNFQLRGPDSELDMELVQQQSAQQGIECHTRRFDTQNYAAARKITIQEAARELRYGWFDELRQTLNYQYIATAHHQGDTIETFFINLVRGTGIRGLTGIKERNQHIVRPLLFANRKQIEAYAAEHQILYRDDASNSSAKYLRNKIRHRVLPTFEESVGSFSQTMLENIARLREIEAVYLDTIEKQRSETVQQTKNEIIIDITKLRKLNPLPTYLFEFLHPYGFNADTVRDIAQSLDKQPGQQFFSPTHRLVKGHDKLLIVSLNLHNVHEELWISRTDTLLPLPTPRHTQQSIAITQFTLNADFKPTNTPNVAFFDADLLNFPLLLRHRHEGDVFYPLGMKGRRKKLSDFFADGKLNRAEKDWVWLLCSGPHIVWVVGRRIDDRFKITESTRQIIRFELIDP
jgi:tRNA(Ile)-lysidine synthase